MRNAQNVVASLLGLAVVLLLVVAGGYAIHVATYHPSIYVSPPESERKGNVQMVREAQNFDGLKQICTYWAEFEDRSRALNKFQLEQFEAMTKGLAVVLGSIGLIFSVGLVYVYIAMRRMVREQPIAL